MSDLLNALRTAAHQGSPIIMDGATGTELEKRGVPMDGVLWNALATASHPEVLQAIHRDYLAAGAQIIIANTFSSSRFMLAHGQEEGRFESLNRSAVRVAQAARREHGSPCWVAGGISSNTLHRSPPPLATMRRDFFDQAALYADEGVDLIALEMMQEADATQAAMEAVADTGLPAWVGFSVKVAADGAVWNLRGDTLFSAILQDLDLSAVQAVGIMHSLTEHVQPALDVLRLHWRGPMYVYAHSGDFIMPNWQFSDIISPPDYARVAAAWVGSGVAAVGGCCGLGPEHISQLAQDLTA